MSQKFGLVVGGASHLGKSIIKNFSKTWNMTNIDYVNNDIVENNILISKEVKMQDQIQQIYSQIDQQKYNAIFFVGTQDLKDQLQKPEIFENYHNYYQNIVQKALLASHLSSRYLNDEGILVLQGCQKAIQDPRYDNASFTVAVNSINTLVSNASKQLSENQAAVALLLEDLDTEENRQLYPNGVYNKWIECDSVAGLLKMWGEGLNRPQSGSFALIKNNQQKLANPTYLDN